ncbi:MAG: hypothetical protein K9N10_17880 [Deltaproteobacteria bacterium]|nr:hypothetical protein [Deltaproteobacteria bacterium]
MMIIYFSDAKNEAARRLLKEIQAKFSGHQIEIMPTIKALWERFRQPLIELAILILAPQNRSQLKELIQMSDLINDHPILLVLPDRDLRTVSMGHKLYPRFVSYLDGDVLSLLAVLTRMVENVGNSERRRQIQGYQ